MRLVISLVLASLSATVTVLAIYAYFSISRHRASLLDDMKKDHRAMVGILLEAIETEAEQHGELQARQLVEEVNRRRDKVHLEWLPFDPTSDPAAGEIAQLDVDDDEHDGIDPRVESRSVVRVWGQPVGTLLLVESLVESEELVEGRKIRIGITALFMLAAGTFVGGALGVVLVGRRVSAMVAQARRVAAGDLDQRIEKLGMDDELGELGREMNAMTARLADARARLEDETAARLRALEQLRHGERLMTVGKLAAGLAHELGTPLNVVTESAKMIIRGETSPAETSEYAGIIAEQGERMTRILRQLLDFARRRTPAREDADLRTLAETTIALLAPLAGKRDVTLRVESHGAPVVRVDVGQIQQVVTNLVDNAIQAAPIGSEVRVDLECVQARPPDDPGAASREHVCITVRDSGDGIAPEHLTRVFEPFFTTKDVGAGTGLGLSVAHGLVVDHGGWIDVESRPGEGATFRVFVPIEGGGRAAAGERLPS